MTILAPYEYMWALGNSSSYKITGLVDGMTKIKLPAATSAFVIGDGNGGLWGTVTDNIDDMKQYVSKGGYLIISCGGANGPYLEDTMTEDQEYTALKSLLDKTGCRALDFDIEGAAVADTSATSKRINVLLRLLKVYPSLYISYTLPVGDPQWGSLTQDSLTLLKTTIKAGLNVNVINGMAMDLYSSTLEKDWGTTAISIIESMKSQIKTLYPAKTDAQVYAMLGVTFMAGENDDGSTFSVANATTVAEYAVKNKMALISFWALQRDQSDESGGLSTSTMIKQTDYAFYNACIAPINSNANPHPVQQWLPGNTYVVGDAVLFYLNKYVCKKSNTAVELQTPDITTDLWLKL